MHVELLTVKGPQADQTWSKGAKRQMANLERFIEKLVSFDEHGPPPESTLNMLESTYLKDPSCDPQHLQNVTNNSACASLCQWVKGVCRFESAFYVWSTETSSDVPVRVLIYAEEQNPIVNFITELKIHSRPVASSLTIQLMMPNRPNVFFCSVFTGFIGSCFLVWNRFLH